MLWRCTECTCAYAAGLPRCPHCSGTAHEEDGAMPKIHKGRLPTYEADIPTAAVEPEPAPEPEPEPVQVKPTPRPRHTRAQAGVARGSGSAKSP
jgi:hypothetical protein